MKNKQEHYLEFDEKYKDFMEDHFSCPLCNSGLEFNYIKNTSTSEMQEEAFCDSCDIKARRKIFVIH